MEGVLGTDKDAVPLEIPDLDVLAAMEVCLYRDISLLVIFSGSETGVVSGLFGFSLV